MVALLIVMLSSFASATGWPAAWFEFLKRDPNPAVAGHPLTISLSIMPTERAPANWVGQITFRVYDPTNNLIYTSCSSISSDDNFASASLTPPTAGMYELQIDYDSPYDNEGFHYGADLPVSESTSVPEAHAGEHYQANEGSPITFDAKLSNDPDGDALQYRWDFESDGTWDTSWSNDPIAIHTWNDDWSGNAKLEVSDGEYTSIDTASVIISNVNPVVNAGQEQTVNEGDAVSFSGSYTDVGIVDTHTVSWDFGDGTTETNTLNPTHVYADNEVYTVTLTVTDDDGGVGTDTVKVTVKNVNPILGEIISPIDPVSLSSQLTTSCTFTDAGSSDTHTGIWSWGDGTSSPGFISETKGEGTVIGEHTYSEAGIYRVTITITDNFGGSDSKTAENNYIVIYNPNGGFVTGGGWINSPAGAFEADKTLTGKATFGFVSKYQKGASIPTGTTEFQFKVANLNFHSENYEWLVVAGPQANYKGSGTINGVGNYGFLLTAVDGAIRKDGIDKFRIKIWNKDIESNNNLVYDNNNLMQDGEEPSTVVSGGSIVIHKE